MGDKRKTYRYKHQYGAESEYFQKRGERSFFSLICVDIRYTIEELLSFYHKAPIAPSLEGKSDVLLLFTP